jgi:hypothetical protein
MVNHLGYTSREYCEKLAVPVEKVVVQPCFCI